MQMRLLLLAFLLILLGCSDIEKVEKRNSDGVVVERYSRSKKDSSLEGTFQLFSEEGVLLEQANYKKGKLDGVRTLYYAEGGVQYEEQHVDGKFDGFYKAYYPDGQLELVGKYENDIATGVWVGYFPDGTKKEEVTFKNNAENGPFKEWYSNGVIRAEGNYLNGDKEDGELKLYDLQGNIKKRMFCESGICRTVWEADKKLEHEG